MVNFRNQNRKTNKNLLCKWVYGFRLSVDFLFHSLHLFLARSHFRTLLSAFGQIKMFYLELQCPWIATVILCEVKCVEVCDIFGPHSFWCGFLWTISLFWLLPIDSFANLNQLKIQITKTKIKIWYELNVRAYLAWPFIESLWSN